MAWSIEYDPEALQDLRKLDRTTQQDILDYMDNRIAKAESPRNFGNPFEAAGLGCGGTEFAITASSVNCKSHGWWFSWWA